MTTKNATPPTVSNSSIWRKLIVDLRQRLSPDASRPLTQEQFARFCGVSWSTVARWEGGGKPDARMSRKLARLEKALDLLGEMVVREDRILFFEQEHPLLLGMRPLDLLDNDAGAEKVMQVLESAASGAFA